MAERTHTTPVGQEDADRDRRIFDRGREAGRIEVSSFATERVRWLLMNLSLELNAALEKFDSFNSPHEGWAVVKEELDELWKHVMENTGRSPGAYLEALQVAAMALRYAHDLMEWGPEK